MIAALSQIPIERLPENGDLMRSAIEGGRAAFRVNCVQCHGAGAAGGGGYPNLNDDDWLWGGDPKAIQFTLVHGVRQPGVEDTRMSIMPAFGRDGMLTSEEISTVADQVLSFSGKARPTAKGAELYANNCAVCHGPAGRGSREFGAPNLARRDLALWWWQGGCRPTGYQSAHWGDARLGARLDPVTIKMLAAYVHSLGGGEDFVEVAEDPA